MRRNGSGSTRASTLPTTASMNDRKIFATRFLASSITYDIIHKRLAAYSILFFRPHDVELFMRVYIALYILPNEPAGFWPLFRYRPQEGRPVGCPPGGFLEPWLLRNHHKASYLLSRLASQPVLVRQANPGTVGALIIKEYVPV